jgi:hypothetical protein
MDMDTEGETLRVFSVMVEDDSAVQCFGWVTMSCDSERASEDEWLRFE